MKKLILSIITVLVVITSTMQITSLAGGLDTYFDGETLTLESSAFPPIIYDKKTVKKYDGEIISEKYVYDSKIFKVVGEQLYSNMSIYDHSIYYGKYLEDNGWELHLKGRPEDGYVMEMENRDRYYTKGDYYIQITWNEYIQELTFVIAKSVDNKDESKVTTEVFDTPVIEDETPSVNPTEPQPEKPADITKQIRMTLGSDTAMVYGKEFKMDVAPQAINGRTMLPARYVVENLGGEIKWIGEHNIVAITKDSMTLIFRIGSDSATFLMTAENEEDLDFDVFDEKSTELMNIISPDYTNENYVYDEDQIFDYFDYMAIEDNFYNYCALHAIEVELDSAPIAISGRTFMPVRIIATFLGAEVSWDGATQTVIIE